MYDVGDEIGERFNASLKRALSELYSAAKQYRQAEGMKVERAEREAERVQERANRVAFEQEAAEAREARRKETEDFFVVDLSEYETKDKGDILAEAEKLGYSFRLTENNGTVDSNRILVQGKYLERFKRLLITKDKELVNNALVAVNLSDLNLGYRKSVIDRINGRGIKIARITDDQALVYIAKKDQAIVEAYVQKAERDAAEAPTRIDLSRFNEDDRRDILFKAHEMGLDLRKLKDSNTYIVKGDGGGGIQTFLGIVEAKEMQNYNEEFVPVELNELKASERTELMARLNNEGIHYNLLVDEITIEVMRDNRDLIEWHTQDIKKCRMEDDSASEHQRTQGAQTNNETRPPVMHDNQMNEPEELALGESAVGVGANMMTSPEEELGIKALDINDDYQAKALENILRESELTFECIKLSDNRARFLIPEAEIANKSNELMQLLESQERLTSVASGETLGVHQPAPALTQGRHYGAVEIKDYQVRPNRRTLTPELVEAEAREQMATLTETPSKLRGAQMR